MNANDNPTQSTETLIVKRGPGRPRGSRNKPILTEKVAGKSPILTGLISRIPLTAAEMDEELRKTKKNISVRATEEQAVRLIYLDKVCHIPKAEAVKGCIDKALTEYYREALAGLHQLDAFDRGMIT